MNKNVLIIILLILYNILSAKYSIRSTVGQLTVGRSIAKCLECKSGFWYLFNKENQSGIEDNLPLAFQLKQNYPNPFNPTTTISFALPEESNVKLTVYNVLGKKVTELANGMYERGVHNIHFDASRFASGQYFYRINAGKHHDIKKMVVLK